MALISLNDSHDHIYVTGTVGLGWDSNVYANSDATSDYSTTASILAEYTRRAGWIGVNANIQLDAARYNDLTSENFNNPRFNAELTKQTGRTTGSLTLSAARQSRADAAVNMRSTSWNYASGLNFRYPIAGRYTLTGSLGYSFVHYLGEGLFPDLGTYSASADLFRILSSERDLTIGYRYRHSETSIDSTSEDHAATVGLSGKLIRGLNGNIRAGYQVRVPHSAPGSGVSDESFSSWTASASATYALNRRINFTGTLAKDFATTATDVSVDTTTASVDAHYAYSARWNFGIAANAGDSRFLGEGGRVVVASGPPVVYGPHRHDNFVSANVSINYSLNEHLKMSASYAWFKNWSTTPFADFVRSSYNLNLSSRW